jgi:hypothetical protein
MTSPCRALCAELADVVYEYCILHEGRDHLQPLVDRARALLDQSVAEEPTDEELWTMYDEMRGEPGDWAWVRDYARAALAKWGHQ